MTGTLKVSRIRGVFIHPIILEEMGRCQAKNLDDLVNTVMLYLPLENEMSAQNLDFLELHETYQPKIHRYLVRLIGEDQAEDLTQEVFLRVSRGLGDFRGDSSFSTWIYRIATNTALDRMRSQAHEQGEMLSLDDEHCADPEAALEDRNPWTGDKTPLPEKQLIEQYLNDCTLAYIQKLPDDFRTVLVLSEFERMRDKQIASILGVSLETVKIRLHRARARLKDDLLDNCEYYWSDELP
jgi:RNA polymerase sigma-70 factor (ECF subfamily)